MREAITDFKCNPVSQNSEQLMDKLISHLKEENFGELKRCKTSAEQNKILAGLVQKRLDEFMAWLEADGATAAALYMQAVGVSLRRK